jgi:thiol-disulfide isomerase/thioredoxin
MRDSSDRPLALDDLRGRIVVLNLWASWCAPCRMDSRRLSRIQRKLGGAGVVVLGLNAEGLRPTALAEIKRRRGIEYAVASAIRPLAETG